MQHSPTVHLEMGVDIQQELAVSNGGSLVLYTTLASHGDDLGSDEGVDLTELMDEMHSDLREDGEYQMLYIAAHEMRRLSEEMYESARMLESSDEAVLRRYNLDPEEVDMEEGLE